MGKVLNKKEAIIYINSLTDSVVLDIKQIGAKKIRSLAQSKYWHGVIVKTISDWSGDDVISVHYMLKTMFNLETTTNLSTDEFAFMCKAIIDLFKTNYGVHIPSPREDEDLKDLEKYLF